MEQIIFHGLGGQGAKSAAQILAEAASEEGKEIQAFPEFGPERRGAPVRAFVRISERKITTHEPIVNPDYTVIIDSSLISRERMKGTVIANSKESAEQIAERTGFKGKVHVIDASALGVIPNLPMLGALVKVSGIAKLETVLSRIEKLFLRKLGKEKTEQNIEAVKKAYEMIE